MTDNLYIPRKLVQRWVDNTDFFEDLSGKSMAKIAKAKEEDEKINEEMRALLATPVVERQEPVSYLVTDIYGQKKALRAGAEGIERHRNAGSDLVPLFAEPTAPVAVVHTMKSVMSAICTINGFPMLTSNQCYALAQSLNKVKELNQ